MTPGPLSPSGEEAWRSLSQHAEWATGSWVGWIFTDAIASGFELHQRLARQLALVGRRSGWWLPQDAEQVEAALRWLLSGADSADGCVWLAWPEGTGRWAESWSELLNRLNERREVLRRALRGGLVFVVPLALKEATRSGAPDLWSIRSFALDVRGVPGDALPLPPRGVIQPLRPSSASGAVAARDLALAEQALHLARAASNVDAEVDALNQLALAHLSAGDLSSAQSANLGARALATDGARLSEALFIAGLIAVELDEPSRAVDHWRESWGLSAPHARPTLIRRLFPVLYRAGAWTLLQQVTADALALPGASTDLLYYMAEALYADGKGDLEAAREFYERFSTWGPADHTIMGSDSAWIHVIAHVRVRLSHIYLMQGDVLKAVGELARRNDLLLRRHVADPDDPHVSASLVLGALPMVALLKREHREEEAALTARQVLAIVKERPGLHVAPVWLREEAARALDVLIAHADHATAAALRAEAAALRAS